MWTALSFTAEPIIGSPLEADIGVVKGFLICSSPDPESFLRDRLSEQTLTLIKAEHIDNPSPQHIQNLPDEESTLLNRQGWCMVIPGISRALRRLRPPS